MTRKMRLTAVFIGDGYFYGAAVGSRSEDPWYWPGVRDDDGFELWIAHVPEAEISRFLDHGTGRQYYSDGYDAASAIAPHLMRRVC